jgi:hypothetical protein
MDLPTLTEIDIRGISRDGVRSWRAWARSLASRSFAPELKAEIFAPIVAGPDPRGQVARDFHLNETAVWGSVKQTGDPGGPTG